MFARFILFVTLAAMYAGGAKSKYNSDSPIVYPGPVKEYHTENRYGSSDDVPDECKDKNYCTIKPASYPQAKYDNLIKYKIPVTQPETEVSDLVDKQGDPDDVDNCETQVEFEPLFKVKSRAGDWRTVVQSPSKNFVQSVRLETCRERNAPCFTIFPKLPSYTTFCKQKYTTWHIVVDSDDPSSETKTEKIEVDLPTCCSCHYKPTD